ncbi:ArsR family transcriptional regulator [Halosimplex aquaticum]
MRAVETDAINDPDLSVLLHHVYGLSGSSVDICVSLLERGEATATDIASDVGVNRSTVSRQLAQLRELGVVECREEPVAGGGRVKRYSSVSLDELRQRHREGLLVWASDAMAVVDRLYGEKPTAAARSESVSSSEQTASDE